MNFHDLEAFLAISEEGSITKAAQKLHISQPALTRQLKALEEEFGVQLAVRGSRQTDLTKAGRLLRHRAQEMLQLAEKTKKELNAHKEHLLSDLYLCAGETEGLHILTSAFKRIRQSYPNVRLHVTSGDGKYVLEQVDEGLADFGLLFGPMESDRYETIPLPYTESFGLLMNADSPLAAEPAITSDMLSGYPLIVPRNPDIYYLLRKRLPHIDNIHTSGTYSLIYNASIMVRDRIGYAVCLDRILNLTGDDLCFRPFDPPVCLVMELIWKKSRSLTPTAKAFLREIHDT